jgi:NAD(P)-dependent dehydrogenase (short-subunit alcohol dehydrogenase family)
MSEFAGKIAVITGAGTGMGRELARALASEGSHLALCDVFTDTLEETRALCAEAAPAQIRITAHRCDVSNEAEVLAFKDEVLQQHGTRHIDLLFNNAGIAGGGSFVCEPRDAWERVFNVNWFGVYYCTRAFLPLLIESRDACLVNTSSVNGFFALSPSGPHTAYSTAKFAIKGFTEALVTDLRVNAPHVRVALVMPGHIGTAIVENALRSQGRRRPSEMTAADLAEARVALTERKIPHAHLDDEQVRKIVESLVNEFRDKAPMSAAQAAKVILDGVRARRWRILVGDDAQRLDKVAREYAEHLYEPEFLARMRAAAEAASKS